MAELRDSGNSPLTEHGSSSVVPPGTCLIHGSFVGYACPTCSTFATVPGLNKTVQWFKCPSCPLLNGCLHKCGWNRG